MRRFLNQWAVASMTTMREHCCIRCGAMLHDGKPLLESLPAFPCGWPEPTLAGIMIVWDGDGGAGSKADMVATADEARGIARRLIELADEADARSEHE